MSVSKLQKQLLRDLKRSPGKAAVLGILCVVAIWFWAPLLMGGKKMPAQTSKPPEATVAAPVIETPAAAAAVVKGVSWQQLVKLIENEPRMQSAQLGSVDTPFGDGEPKPEQSAPATAQAPAVVKDIPPDPAKIKVTSTLLGPRRRVAVINGRPYAEGEELPAGEDAPYLIARVTERSVFVERNGRRWELTIERKPSTPAP